MTRIRKDPTAATRSMKRVVKALTEHGPLAKADILHFASIAGDTFQSYLLRPGERQGLFHISGYQRDRYGRAVPVFTVGPRPAGHRMPRKPKALSWSVTSKAWKLRSGYEEWRRAANPARRLPDPVMAALLGIKGGVVRQVQP